MFSWCILHWCHNIDENEQKAYKLFTDTFGGGLSGNPLKNLSLNCCKIAIEERSNTTLTKEFAIIRTGGIETFKDLKESDKIGVDLNQWFTGYFEAFAKYGHNLYKELVENAKSWVNRKIKYCWQTNIYQRVNRI